MRRRLLLAGGVALPLALGAPVMTRAVAQAEAERQLDAAIARLRAGLGPDGAVEWRSRSVDPATGTARFQDIAVRRGGNRFAAAELTLEGATPERVGRATAAGIRIEEPRAAGEGGGSIVVTAGRVTMGDLVLPATAGGGPALDLANLAVGEAQAEGIRMVNPGRGESELGRLVVAGYAPGTVREATLEGFRFHDRSPDPKRGEVRMNVGRARLTGAAIPRIGAPADPWALAADTALIEGGEILAAAQGTNIRLGRLQLDGWGPGRLTTLALEGARVDGETDRTGPYLAELGRVAVAGVPLRDTAHAFAHDLTPPSNRPGQEQTASVEGLSVSAGGTPLLTVGALRARNGWDPARASVETGTLTAEGIALGLPGEYGGDRLAELGFKRILARLGIDSRLDRAAEQLVSDPFRLQLQGMGTLTLTMDIRGVTLPEAGQPAPPQDDPMALAARWSVAAMSVRYAEEGLVQALLARQAAEENVPVASLRERYAALAARTPVPGSQGKDGPQVTALRNALSAFARDLGTIEIAMRPARPLPLLEFASLAGRPPEQVMRELNVTARATPPGR